MERWAESLELTTESSQVAQDVSLRKTEPANESKYFDEDFWCGKPRENDRLETDFEKMCACQDVSCGRDDGVCGKNGNCNRWCLQCEVNSDVLTCCRFLIVFQTFSDHVSDLLVALGWLSGGYTWFFAYYIICISFSTVFPGFLAIGMMKDYKLGIFMMSGLGMLTLLVMILNERSYADAARKFKQEWLEVNLKKAQVHRALGVLYTQAKAAFPPVSEQVPSQALYRQYLRDDPTRDSSNSICDFCWKCWKCLCITEVEISDSENQSKDCASADKMDTPNVDTKMPKDPDSNLVGLPLLKAVNYANQKFKLDHGELTLKFQNLQELTFAKAHLAGEKGIIFKFTKGESNFPAYQKDDDQFQDRSHTVEFMEAYNTYIYEHKQDLKGETVWCDRRHRMKKLYPPVFQNRSRKQRGVECDRCETSINYIKGGAFWHCYECPKQEFDLCLGCSKIDDYKRVWDDEEIKYKREVLEMKQVALDNLHNLKWITGELRTLDRNLSHILLRLNLPEVYKVWELSTESLPQLFLQFNAYFHGYYDEERAVLGISSTRVLQVSLLLSFVSNVWSSVKVFETRGLGLNLLVLMYALIDTFSRGLSVALWKETDIGPIVTILFMILFWAIAIFWIFLSFTEMRRAWGFGVNATAVIGAIAFIVAMVTILSPTPLIYILSQTGYDKNAPLRRHSIIVGESVLRSLFSLILFAQADFQSQIITFLAPIGMLCALVAPIVIRSVPSVIESIPTTGLFLDPFEKYYYKWKDKKKRIKFFYREKEYYIEYDLSQTNAIVLRNLLHDIKKDHPNIFEIGNQILDIDQLSVDVHKNEAIKENATYFESENMLRYHRGHSRGVSSDLSLNPNFDSRTFHSSADSSMRRSLIVGSIIWICVIIAIVIFIYAWNKGYVEDPVDQFIYTFYAIGFTVAAFISTAFFADDSAWTLFRSLQFRQMVMSGLVLQFTNCYSDLALLYNYAYQGETELAVVFSIAMVIYRIVSVAWVWTNFHSIRICVLQLFELLAAHEAYRSFTSKVLFISMYQIYLFEIVLEDVPSTLINVSYIASKNFKIDSAAVPIGLVSSLLSIIFHNISFDHIKMRNNQIRDRNPNFILHITFRLSESFSRLGALAFVYIHSPWFLITLFIIEASVIFYINMKYTDKEPNSTLKYTLLWFTNIPALSFETLGWHLQTKERRKVMERNQEVSGSHFQRLFSIIHRKTETYADALNLTYEYSKAEKISLTSLGDTIDLSDLDPPKMEESDPPRKDGIYGYYFVILCLFVRALSNLILLIVFGVIFKPDIDSRMVKMLTYCVVIGSIVSIICMRLLIYGDTIIPETGETQVWYPFFKWMDWTEFLEHEVVLQQYHSEGQHLATKSQISHIENFVIMGNNVMFPNAKGQLITTLAARLGNIHVIKACLKAGLDMNMADSWGYTPLFLAIAMGHQNIVKLLLSYDYPCHLCQRSVGPLVDPNLRVAGGFKLPPILGAALFPRRAHTLIDLLCERDVKITTMDKTGNLLHYAFDLRIGKYSVTESHRERMLEHALFWADIQDCRQDFLDARLPDYCDSMYNYYFPVTVLDRIVYDDGGEDYRPLIDLLLKEGATVYPSVASVALKMENFDMLEYIFTNTHLIQRVDPLDILTEPWHGGTFYARYAGEVMESEDEKVPEPSHSEDTDNDKEERVVQIANSLKSNEFILDDDDRIELVTEVVDSPKREPQENCDSEIPDENSDVFETDQEEEYLDFFIDLFRDEDGTDLIGRCRFCECLEFPEEMPYGCELFDWDRSHLEMPTDIWKGQYLKSIYPPSSEREEDLVYIPYQSVKNKLQEFPPDVPFRIRTTTGDGFQRRLLRMHKDEYDDVDKFVDFYRKILEAHPDHEGAQDFLRSFNSMTPRSQSADVPEDYVNADIRTLI